MCPAKKRYLRLPMCRAPTDVRYPTRPTWPRWPVCRRNTRAVAVRRDAMCAVGLPELRVTCGPRGACRRSTGNLGDYAGNLSSSGYSDIVFLGNRLTRRVSVGAKCLAACSGGINPMTVQTVRVRDERRANRFRRLRRCVHASLQRWTRLQR